MSKILSFIILALIVAAIIFIANLFSDLLFILYKKISKKIRSALGLPVKEEPKKDEVPSDETPSEEEKPKNNTNDILQKLLAKRKNATSDVEQPAEQGQNNDEIEVTEFEVKE